jgi:hypothetical protein
MARHKSTPIYIGIGGHVAVQSTSGEEIWRTKVKGLGHGLITFAGSELAASAATMQAAQAATTAAIVAATA